jgi:hypothetical protein
VLRRPEQTGRLDRVTSSVSSRGQASLAEGFSDTHTHRERDVLRHWKKRHTLTEKQNEFYLKKQRRANEKQGERSSSPTSQRREMRLLRRQ